MGRSFCEIHIQKSQKQEHYVIRRAGKMWLLGKTLCPPNMITMHSVIPTGVPMQFNPQCNTIGTGGTEWRDLLAMGGNQDFGSLNSACFTSIDSKQP